MLSYPFRKNDAQAERRHFTGFAVDITFLYRRGAAKCNLAPGRTYRLTRIAWGYLWLFAADKHLTIIT